MKWPNLSYSIPPKTPFEWFKMISVFVGCTWLALDYARPMIWTAVIGIFIIDMVSIGISARMARANKTLNDAILDSIKAIKDCYTMLTAAEWNLHRAEVMLAQRGYAFVREPPPADPREDARLLRFHLKRALAELEKNGIEFNLLDGEVELGQAKAQTQDA